MESREITRDEIVQALANLITGTRTISRLSITNDPVDTFSKGAKAGAQEIARTLGLTQELDDVLYLMEEGPE